MRNNVKPKKIYAFKILLEEEEEAKVISFWSNFCKINERRRELEGCKVFPKTNKTKKTKMKKKDVAFCVFGEKKKNHINYHANFPNSLRGKKEKKRKNFLKRAKMK